MASLSTPTIEILLEAVVSPTLQPSSGPGIELFKRFKKNKQTGKCLI